MDPDAQAMEYARSYALRGAGDAPSPETVRYIPAPARGDGRTTRTLIVVAGIVAVAWLWFRSRRA